VRKFLKPFLRRGMIASDCDLERLSKKLAQKVNNILLMLTSIG
jgi:hypothetical protein